MKMPLRIVLIIAAVLLIALAAYYWTTPANALAGFVPGYDPHSTEPHAKHALASVLLAVVCLVGVWFSTGKKHSQDTPSESAE